MKIFSKKIIIITLVLTIILFGISCFITTSTHGKPVHASPSLENSIANALNTVFYIKYTGWPFHYKSVVEVTAGFGSFGTTYTYIDLAYNALVCIGAAFILAIILDKIWAIFRKKK